MTTVTCKIPEELHARLEREARRRRISKSALLREALAERLSETSPRDGPAAHDLVKHLCGKLRGPRNLSTNPARLKGLGA